MPLFFLDEMFGYIAFDKVRWAPQYVERPVEYASSSCDPDQALKYIARPVKYVLQKQLYISEKTWGPPQEHLPSDLLHLVRCTTTSPPPYSPINIASINSIPACRCSPTCSARAEDHRQGDSSQLLRLLSGPWTPNRDLRRGVAPGFTSSWRRATYYSKYADLRFKRREFRSSDEWTILDIETFKEAQCLFLSCAWTAQPGHCCAT
jgi:hypothetical protein